MKKGKYILFIFLFFLFLVTADGHRLPLFRFRRPPEIAGRLLPRNRPGRAVPGALRPGLPDGFLLGGRTLSVHDVWESLRKAKVDDRIRCVLLRLGYLECDWAKISEIRDAVLDFRESGKRSTPTSRRLPNSTRNITWRPPATGSSSIRSAGWASTASAAGCLFQRGAGQAGDRSPVRARRGIQDRLQHVHGERVSPMPTAVMMEAIEHDIFAEYVRAVAEPEKTEDDSGRLIDTALFQGSR